MKPAELREVRSGFPVVCYRFHYGFQGFGVGFSAEVRSLSGRAREGERRDTSAEVHRKAASVKRLFQIVP